MEISDSGDDDESLVGTSVADEKSQLREEIKSLKQQLAEAKSSLEKGQNDMKEARESAENMKRTMEEKFRIGRFGLENFPVMTNLLGFTLGSQAITILHGFLSLLSQMQNT